MVRRADARGAAIVDDLFGVNVQQQGQGFYVALELLAIAHGVLEVDPDALLWPGPEVVRYVRTSHDMARRLATRTDIKPEELNQAVQGEEAAETLRELFSSLVVQIPGRRAAPKWMAAYLYPFVGELIHYDAVDRRGRPQIERYMFRDGGGWAYKVLRSDPVVSRRLNTKEHLAFLVQDSGTALGRVASALGTHDAAPRSDVPFADDSESKTRTMEEFSNWPEVLREGCANIVGRVYVPRAKRIEQLMHFVPYCLARHELRLARQSLGHHFDFMPVDFATEPNPLRATSQSLLNEYRWNIASALCGRAALLLADAQPEQKARFLDPSDSYTSSPRAFFTGTLAAVGALNAVGGRRHFTLKAPMIEAIAAATLKPESEMEYHEFCQVLLDSMCIVIDQRSARVSRLNEDIDEGVFRTNSEVFRSRLQTLGLVTQYSDATSLVHGETR